MTHVSVGKGSKTHVPVSFQVFFFFFKMKLTLLQKPPREQGKVTRREGSGRV